MGPTLRTERDCARKCARKCPRCNYVSVSLKDSDCSWYAKCDVSRLEFLSFTGHRTVAVKR